MEHKEVLNFILARCCSNICDETEDESVKIYVLDLCCQKVAVTARFIPNTEYEYEILSVKETD